MNLMIPSLQRQELLIHEFTFILATFRLHLIVSFILLQQLILMPLFPQFLQLLLICPLTLIFLTQARLLQLLLLIRVEHLPFLKLLQRQRAQPLSISILLLFISAIFKQDVNSLICLSFVEDLRQSFDSHGYLLFTLLLYQQAVFLKQTAFQ